MPALLFSLKDVPEDEAQETRDLLKQHNIDFYETPAGNWGVSMPAIWLRDTDQLPLAQQLLAQYQQQRYHAAQQAGGTPTLLGNFLKRPGRFLLHTAYALFILYCSVQLVSQLANRPPPKNPPTQTP